MRYLTIVVIAFVCYGSAYGQRYELGVFAGGANFIGDVGKTAYLSPNSPVAGGIAKWNRSPRHSFRFTFLVGSLEAYDEKSDEERRRLRGYDFQSTFFEASLGMEYTFWEFNMNESGTYPSTPYLYTGIVYNNHEDFFLDTSENNLAKVGASGDFGIPMALGFKAALSRHIIFAIEVGARYMFTDNLDGSDPDFEGSQSLKFGNLNNNDWYMFSGVTLTYTFGRPPCYCGF